MADDLKNAKVLFVLGGPGSGKGTQCEKMVAKYGFTHLSTGDLLREELKNESELSAKLKDIMAKGELVSQETILELLVKAMKSKLAQGAKFIIDGFPRDVPQGEKFEATVVPCVAVLYFHVSNETMVERLLNRAKTSGRVDDNEETIKLRLKTFEDQTLPVVDKYKDKLIQVDASRSIDAIFADVCKGLDKCGM